MSNRIIEITNFSDPALDVYARLTENQLVCRAHPEEGLFIAESPNVIERALDAGYEPVSLLMEHKHIEGQAAHIVARCPDVPLYTAPLSVLTELTGFPLTRGVLCAMRRKPLRRLEEILSPKTAILSERSEPKDLCVTNLDSSTSLRSAQNDRGDRPSCRGEQCSPAGGQWPPLHTPRQAAQRIAVLENIMNPTNLGAIFRSAAALGMDAVLLTHGCADPLYRRAVRVSMGTVFQIPWAFIGDDPADWPHPGMERLRQAGFRTAAMALDDRAISVSDPRLAAEEKLAIVLGTEGDGLCAQTIADCDYTVKIPMSHGVDSLNVAAASAVAFWQLRRSH